MSSSFLLRAEYRRLLYKRAGSGGWNLATRTTSDAVYGVKDAPADFRKLSRVGSRRSAQLFMHLGIIFWRSCRAITFRLLNKGCESNGDEVT